MESPRLVCLKKLSQMFGISVPQLRKLIKTGMPHRRIKRKIWVKPDEFEVWFDENFRVGNDRNSKRYGSVLDEIISDIKSENR